MILLKIKKPQVCSNWSSEKPVLQPPFSSNDRRKSTLNASDDYLARNQTFSHNQKYMTPKQNH